MPLPVWKTWKPSQNCIDTVRHRLRMPVTVFHRTSTKDIPGNSPSPFGINITVYQVHSYMRRPYHKLAWIRPTTFSQWTGLGDSNLNASTRQERGCYTLMMDVTPDLFLQRRRTIQATSSSLRKNSSTEIGVSETRMIRPGGKSPVKGYSLCCNQFYIQSLLGYPIQDSQHQIPFREYQMILPL